jgi:hypothetical protein
VRGTATLKTHDPKIGTGLLPFPFASFATVA